MGVPSYFNWLIQKYKTEAIIATKPTFKIENLFLDLNCAIHPAVKADPNYTIDQMYQAIIVYIDNIVNFVNPSGIIYLAIDGVAPLAKMNQQRDRRYKTVLFNKEKSKIYEKYKKKEDKTIHDYNMISPATDFMKNLSICLKKHYINKLKNYILSDASEPGEGEHKIFDYIRKNKIKNYVIYGLDADLIFLSLINLENTNCLLVRESNMILNSMEINQKYLYLDINLLYTKLIEELQNTNDPINNPINDHNIIIDYVFISFFLGNDFLPHIPSLSIKDGVLDILINIYKETNKITNKYLINIKENYIINYEFMYHFLTKLSENETDLLLNSLEIKTKRMNNMAKKMKYMSPFERELEELNYIEFKQPDIYIQYDKPDYNKRYNKYYFNNNKQIYTDYMYGLRWVLLYYLGLNKNWSWMYKWPMGPLINDLRNVYIKKMGEFNIKFIETEPINPYLQLIYILPYESINLLPAELKIHLKQNLYFHILYPTNIKLDMVNKKYFNEAILHLPEINLENLEYIFMPIIKLNLIK